MDAAAQQQPAAGASGNLSIDSFIEGSITCLRFQGTIDESFDGRRLAAGLKATTLILDMGAVRKISSFGIREWTDFIKTCERSVDTLIAIECTPKVVDQLNMVSQFLGTKGRVFSLYAPYRCDYCDIDRKILLQVDRDAAAIRSQRPPEQLCETCSRPSYFDEEPASFFAYLAQQPPFELSPAIAEFLSSKLRYSVTGGDRRLHIDKHIEGRNTYLKFVGNLDGSFPSGKIAEGLEGTMVVDVSGIGTIDLAGAAEWRNFVTQTKSGAERVYLVGCPPVLLERLNRQGDLGDQVISFTMPYSCSKCATTAAQLIDVEQHYDILKFATPPEMKCAHCKSPTVCVAPEALLSRLRTLPRVDIDSGLKKFIKEMRDRKPVPIKAPRQPGAADARLGMFTGLIILALVAAGVLIGVNWYQTREARETQKKMESVIDKVEGGQVGAVTRASFSRPIWITSDTPGTAFCTDIVNRLSCVGISAYVDSREEGRLQATNAAFEEMTNSIGLKIDNPAFQSRVRPMYEAARAKGLNDLEAVRGTPGAEYQKARERVDSARKAVAQALVATGGAAAPAQQSAWYWEEYDKPNGAGTEFLVFVRYDIGQSAMTSLMITYADVIDAGGGGKVVTLFPSIAWALPTSSGGALVVRSSGDLARIGVPENAVVTAIDGTAVRTAPDMVARLKKAGRSAKVTVVMPDGSVKELGG